MIIAVTIDEYEHIVAVADSAQSMARLLRINSSTVYKGLHGKRNFQNKPRVPYKFIKIEDEEE